MADEDKKLYDSRGKDYDRSITTASVIFAYPLGFAIMLAIGSIFGIIGVSIVLWILVFAIIGVSMSAPFSAVGRLFATVYLAVLFWVFTSIALFIQWSYSTQSTIGFCIIMGVGGFIALTGAPKGRLIFYRPSPTHPHPDYMINQMTTGPQPQYQPPQDSTFHQNTPNTGIANPTPDVVVETLYCSNCGSKNNQAYCPECGTKMG